MRPIFVRSSTASETTSHPATRAVPFDGAISVVRTLTSVVFPAPFGPKIDRNAPFGSSKLTPSSALRTPKLRTRSRMSSASGAASSAMLGRDRLALRPHSDRRAREYEHEPDPAEADERVDLGAQLHRAVLVHTLEHDEHVAQRLVD